MAHWLRWNTLKTLVAFVTLKPSGRRFSVSRIPPAVRATTMFRSLLVFSLLTIHSAAADDTLEKLFREQTDQLYSIICRHPRDLYVDLRSILMCPNFYPRIEAPFEFEDLIFENPRVWIKKCSSRYGYCPTREVSRCVPASRQQRRVTFPLKNGLVVNLDYLDEVDCICSYEKENNSPKNSCKIDSYHN